MVETTKERVLRLSESLRLVKELGAEPVPVKPQEQAYEAPSITLLKNYRNMQSEDAPMNPVAIEDKLREFGFACRVENIRRGPFITRYEVRLAPGVKLAQVKNVADDLAVALMSDRIRILAPIPGTSLVGIEVVNENPDIIGLKNQIKAAKANKKDELPVAIGSDTVGVPVTVDLAKMPHLLIAGCTGSGKSVCLNAIILSLLYTKTPEECELILVDPKRVEMCNYNGISNTTMVTDSFEAVTLFRELVREMERRYETLSQAKVRNIVSYNQQILLRESTARRMPYMVVVVDEMADLMMTSGKALETYIVRLAQLARAVGIHLVLATQKPIVKVITGLIKSNMPSRIAFQVMSKTDSRVILDENGAEKLAGRGDMLMIRPGSQEPERFHGAFVSDDEIERVCNFLKGGHECKT